jgi:hypothetical protein
MPLNHTTSKQEFQVPSAANAALAALERDGKLCKKKAKRKRNRGKKGEEKKEKRKEDRKKGERKLLTGFVIVGVFPLPHP